MKTLSRKRSKTGFTLVEMLIVLGILGILITLTIGNADKFLSGAEEDTAHQFVNTTLKAPLLKYRMDMGSYPSSSEGIKALVEKPSGAKASKWRGPYIEKMPEDPWGNPYQYKYPGTKNTSSYDLWSTGRDTADASDDIGNWE